MCSLSAVYFRFSLHNILSLGKTTYSIIVCASFQNTLLHIPLISYLPEYLQEVINCKFSLNFKSKRQKSYCKNCHLEKKLWINNVYYSTYILLSGGTFPQGLQWHGSITISNEVNFPHGSIRYLPISEISSYFTSQKLDYDLAR